MLWIFSTALHHAYAFAAGTGSRQKETARLLCLSRLRSYRCHACACRVRVHRTLLPPSPQQPLLLGLDLLRLLVQNRIAEFHTELELMSAEVGTIAIAAV